jgi:hypothetical protein
LKYLVSITPDGLINFISTGFGVRTTEKVVMKQSLVNIGRGFI